MVQLLFYVWQLPQNLLGLVMILLLRCTRAEVNGVTVYVHHVRRLSSCSLGRYILLRHLPYTNSTVTVMHELGHCRQSRALGPLYLLLIGIPSVAGNLLHRRFRFDYYSLPWEKSADRLGGVKRNRSI